MSSKCEVPSFDNMSKDEKDASTAKMLKNAGITACKTSNTQAAFAAQMKSLVGSVQVGGSMSTTNTVGCEQLVAAAKKYVNAVQDVTCNIIKSSQSVKSSLSSINSIEFKAVSACGDPYVDSTSYLEALKTFAASGYPEFCKSSINIKGDVNIKQGSKIDYVSKISLSSNAKAKIIEKSKEILETALGVSQDTKTGAGSTPQGSKVLNELTYVSKSQSIQQAITNTSKSISMEIVGGNKIVFRAAGDLNFEKNINITQDSLLKIVSENLIGETMKFLSNRVKESIKKSNDEIKQKSVALAPPSALDIFNIKTSSWMYIIGGIIVLTVIILLFVFMSKKTSGNSLGKLANTMMKMKMKK